MVPREARQSVVLHPVDAPGPFAGFDAQTGLLGVDGEDRKLRFGEGACKGEKKGLVVIETVVQKGL